MFQQIDLRELAERRGSELAYVSLYASGPETLKGMKKRVERIRALLESDEAELEHFDESLRMVREALEDYEFRREGVAVFSCFAEDFLVGYPLTVSVPDLLRVDDSPYIRPLVELRDEYENFVVVAADARVARILLVTSGLSAGEERVRGDVKQRVKKGGWSQKRYERRRGEEMLAYAKEVAGALADLDGRAEFRRVVLLGSDEAMRAIRGALPETLAEKVVGQRSVDLAENGDDAGALVEAAYESFFEREREEEAEVWERIRGELLKGGLGAVGPADVLEALEQGRVEVLLADRELELQGARCRECEKLHPEALSRCPVCGSDGVFPLELVEELVELATLSSARVEFADAGPDLSGLGGVAALLRY